MKERFLLQKKGDEINEKLNDIRDEIITDYNELENKPIENEAIDNSLYITDNNGNIIAYIDNTGLHAYNLYVNNDNVALKKEIENFATKKEVADEIAANNPGFAYNKDLNNLNENLNDISNKTNEVQKKAENAYNLAKKADSEHFSGKYDDLENKPIENESVENTLYIADVQGNIIARFDSNGLSITNVNSKEFFENDVSLNNKYSTIEKANSLTSSLDEISLALSENTYGFAKTSSVGQASGIAPLDATGKIASSYLPSYVDDVLEYTNRGSFPTTGETGKIYINISDGKTYRWSGSTYVEISASLALGETSSTAYPGDKGAANAIAISNLQSGKLDKTAQSVDSAKLGGVEANKYVLNTKLEQDKSVLNEAISNVRNEIITDYNNLDNRPVENEAVDNTLYIADENGNIVALFDNNGLKVSNITMNGKQVATLDDIPSGGGALPTDPEFNSVKVGETTYHSDHINYKGYLLDFPETDGTLATLDDIGTSGEFNSHVVIDSAYAVKSNNYWSTSGKALMAWNGEEFQLETDLYLYENKILLDNDGEKYIDGNTGDIKVTNAIVDGDLELPEGGSVYFNGGCFNNKGYEIDLPQKNGTLATLDDIATGGGSLPTNPTFESIKLGPNSVGTETNISPNGVESRNIAGKSSFNPHQILLKDTEDNLSGEDIREGLTAIVSVKIEN